MNYINDKAKNICLKCFKTIEEFDKWKDEHPTYIIYSVQPIKESKTISIFITYKIINPI